MEIAPKNRRDRQFSIEEICDAFSLKRDAYYKYTKRYRAKKEVEQTVVKLVRKSRRTLPREGTRKLMKSLHQDFENLHLKIGRDRLFSILRDNELLVKRKKYSSRTTNSYHRFYKYNNIIQDLKIDRPNQVWASDITYIRTIKGFCYLALITDLYSRKIVGYDLSDSLELKGCVRALNKAIYNAEDTSQLIHHSDRGIQYCSNIYTRILKRKNINISMTEINHCYENAIAERLNGILKDEFYLDQTFASVVQAKNATKNAVKLYNNKRLHLSLDYKTPNDVHQSAA
jgi:transposase InsO family protein